MTETTRQILLHVAAGNLDAIEDCMDRFGGLIESLARRYLGPRGDLDAAVQAVFAELLRSVERYDPSIVGEKAFVTMIARRCLIDRARRQPCRSRFRDGPTVECEPSISVDLPQADTSAEATEAYVAMAGLRPEQRQVVQLAIHYGWSHSRIAESLRLPIGSVKAHVRCALVRIHDRLMVEAVGTDLVGAGREVTP